MGRTKYLEIFRWNGLQGGNTGYEKKKKKKKNNQKNKRDRSIKTVNLWERTKAVVFEKSPEIHYSYHYPKRAYEGTVWQKVASTYQKRETPTRGKRINISHLIGAEGPERVEQFFFAFCGPKKKTRRKNRIRVNQNRPKGFGTVISPRGGQGQLNGGRCGLARPGPDAL